MKRKYTIEVNYRNICGWPIFFFFHIMHAIEERANAFSYVVRIWLNFIDSKLRYT